MNKKIFLKKDRERSLLRKHPWIFSGAIATIEGKIESGETVSVFSSNQQFLGYGAFSLSSQIRVRMWTFEENEKVDETFFLNRIKKAMTLRENLLIKNDTNAMRIISAESDGLPGLIVDQYDNVLVCQFLSTGVEFWKDIIVKHLSTLHEIKSIYERSDVAVRKKEGLFPKQGLLWGEEPPSLISISEHEVNYFVDIRKGHKTGFYLDQRDNRKLVQSYSAGKDVLNCFSYSGGFGLTALKGGAKSVINVEDSAELIDFSNKNFELNHFKPQQYTTLKADVFKLLRQYDEQNKSFDLIILDPPKFAESQKTIVRASRGYKDINRLAFKLLRPGGLLFTFSCSGLMDAELFQKIVASAATDAGRDVQILQRLGQSPDHQVILHIPESFYLKGLLLRLKD